MNNNFYFNKQSFTESNIITLIKNIPDRVIPFAPQFKFLFENKFKFVSDKFGAFRVDDILYMLESIGDNVKFNLHLVYYDKNIEFKLTTNFDWEQVNIDKNIYVNKRPSEKVKVSIYNYKSDEFGCVTRILKTNENVWSKDELKDKI